MTAAVTPRQSILSPRSDRGCCAWLAPTRCDCMGVAPEWHREISDAPMKRVSFAEERLWFSRPGKDTYVADCITSNSNQPVGLLLTVS